MRNIYTKFNSVICLLLWSCSSLFGQENYEKIKEDSINNVLKSSSIIDEYNVTSTSMVSMSPNTASLTKYADYPVSHYTGIPSISIPIYEINIDGFILPVSLSYHASGVQVNQEASWVGLGWSLNAGGVVSRTIKGADDFSNTMPEGYYYKPVSNKVNWDDYFSSPKEPWYGALTKDNEPDIFYYSYPGGSGKFLINQKDGALLFKNDPNVKIEVFPYESILPSLPVKSFFFVITSPDGTKYEYKQYELTQSKSARTWVNENSETEPPIVSHSADWSTSRQKISAWYLTKIVTNTNRAVEFIYDRQEEYVSPQYESCTKYTSFGPANPHFLALEYLLYYANQTITTSWALSEIRWNYGSIKLSTSKRNDMEIRLNRQVEKLDLLSIFDISNNLIKEFRFNYDYFNSGYVGKYNFVYKRLKLTGIIEQDLYGNIDNSYGFKYFEGALPAKNSNNKDYWGYNNGKKYGPKYYCAAKNFYMEIYEGALKTADLNFAKIGTLKEIKYPTGESTIFTYELNSFDQESWDSEYSYAKNRLQFETFTTSEKNEFPAYDITEKDTQTFTLKYNSNLTIEGSLHNLKHTDPNHIDNPSWGYDDPRNYPQAILRRISPDPEIITSYGTPNLSNNSNRIYKIIPNEFKYLPAGTYVFEVTSPINNVLSEWTINWTEPVERPKEKEKAGGGGLRIAEMRNSAKVRKFVYPTGKHLIEPTFGYTQSIQGRMTYGSLGAYTLYFAQPSESTIPFSSFSNGNYVGYDWVEELIATEKESLKTKYFFFNDFEEKIQNSPELGGVETPFARVFYRELMQNFPYKPIDIKYSNGLVKEINYYKDDKIIEKITNEYLTSPAPPIYGFVFKLDESLGYDDTTGKHEVVLVNRLPYHYNYNIEWLYKNKEVTTFYENNGQTTDAKEFTYNNYYQLESITSFRNNESHKKQIYYSTDLLNSINKDMSNAYMIGVPIEQTYLKDGQIIAGKKTEFSKFNNIILPKNIYTLDILYPQKKDDYQQYYNVELFYDKYTSEGQPSQIRDKSITTVYLWSYSGQYPIAEIKNTTYADVSKTIDIEALSKKLQPSENDYKAIRALDNSLSNALITTYTYQPLVGMTSMTDTRGVTTYYDYDSFGRLKETYIMENGVKKIIQVNDYHYQNQ